MEKTAVQKLAGVLKILVTITFVCNLIVLVMVPGLVHISVHQGLVEWWQYDADDTLHILLFGGWGQLGKNGGYADVLSAFLLFCGICTAVILWQGRRVLGTILTGAPFRAENGVSLRRAVCHCIRASFTSVPASSRLWRKPSNACCHAGASCRCTVPISFPRRKSNVLRAGRFV